VKGAAQFWLDLLPPESDGSKPASKRREYCLKVLDLLKKAILIFYMADQRHLYQKNKRSNSLKNFRKIPLAMF